MKLGPKKKKYINLILPLCLKRFCQTNCTNNAVSLYQKLETNIYKFSTFKRIILTYSY